MLEVCVVVVVILVIVEVDPVEPVELEEELEDEAIAFPMQAIPPSLNLLVVVPRGQELTQVCPKAYDPELHPEHSCLGA